MARPHPSDHASSDDDAPEVVSQFLSRRDAKRVEKNFRDFEAEENVRKKVQNQERDRKLKERAVITRMGKPSGNVWRKEKRKTQRENDAESDHSACSAKDDETPEDPLEMRMRRAMQDAATETGDEDDTKSDGDSEDMSDEEMDEGSDEGGIDEEMTELDAERRLEEDGEGDDVEGEASDEDEDQRRIFPKSSAKGQYLEDGLFAAAFTSSSQNAMAVPTATKSSQKAQLSRKRQRRRLAHPKDLLVGYVIGLLCCLIF